MLPLLALLFLLASSAPAASLEVADAASAGMSAERLERIGAWLDGMVERREAAGFVTIVSRRGKIVHHEAHGHRGMSVDDPMPLDALFDIASMTKAVTVTAALMLLEQGRFTLNDPVGDYLPGFAAPRVRSASGGLEPAASPITIRHLFAHTSGVRDPRSRAETFAFPTLEAYMEDFAQLPLLAQPGSTWLYGDSHDVLGLLVQEVSGRPLDEFVRERILDPLGMADTHYWPPASKDSRRAILVVDGKDDFDSTSRRPLAAAEAATLITGASGLYSTAADYLRLTQMLLNGGELDGKRLLAPRTLELAASDHLLGAAGFDRPGQTFGLGFAVVTDPAAAGLFYSKGSYYWGGSQGTLFWIDPAEELTAVLMVQSNPNGRLKLREKFAALVYSAIVD